MNKIKPWYKTRKSEHDVILSASYDLWISLFARRLGVKVVIATKTDINGKITAEDGQIGGWTIGTDSLYAAGLDENDEKYVSLSTGDPIYAIWAGAELSSSAPFRVARDGTVYLTKLYVTDENGVAQSKPVDLRTSYWKVDSAYAHAVKTLSVEGNTLTIGLYDGTSVNFKKAAPFVNIDQTWSGGRLIISTNTDEITLLGETTASVNSTPSNLTWGGTNNAIATFDITSDRGNIINGMKVDATSVYNTGWNECRDAMSSRKVLYAYTKVLNADLYYKNGQPFGHSTVYYGGSEVTFYTKPNAK